MLASAAKRPVAEASSSTMQRDADLKKIARQPGRSEKVFLSLSAARSNLGRYAWLEFLFVSTLDVTAIATGARRGDGEFAPTA